MKIKITNDITELVGNTPLMRLTRYADKYGCKASILAKLEAFNPAGSIKDRAALNMIEDYERRGILGEGSVIIEPTSGNTGIGLASVAAVKGYKAILTMPETMSVERRKLLAAYGAQIVLTEGKQGMAGAVAKAEELAASTPGSIIVGQFSNKANAEAHYKTTAPEIWEQTDGNIDVFISAVGTGGTLTGCARYLKEKNSNIKIVAVEPTTSPLLSKGYAGPHKIQGIGANFIPDVLDISLIDEIITVSNEDAFASARNIATSEGFLVGISSGAAAFAATIIAGRSEYENKNIVVILPDTGERYLSSGLFD